MGHMLLFGLVAIVGGLTQSVGREGGAAEDFGYGMIVAGVTAIVWAGVVLFFGAMP